MPCEIAECVPFEQDTLHAAYDANYAKRFWCVLLSASEVFSHFRTGFLGKTSPVHFFWGSFDLAVTPVSGRVAAGRSIMRRSILTPIQRRTALARRRCGQRKRSSARSWASFCCL